MLGKNYESKIKTMMRLLNEKQKRLYLASEAIAIGRGGVTEVSRISGISRSVITAGIKDIKDGDGKVLSIDAPIRRKGAGRKPITETQLGMFSQISQNWRGKPLVSLAVIVNLIAATTTNTGLSIQCQLDLNQYPKGIIISDDELASLNMVGDEFHPNWNYTILPQTT